MIVVFGGGGGSANAEIMQKLKRINICTFCDQRIYEDF